MTAEEKFAQVSQPIDAPFLSLAERQDIADGLSSPRRDRHVTPATHYFLERINRKSWVHLSGAAKARVRHLLWAATIRLI